MAAIKSKFKTIQGQAYHMLQKWQSSGTHTKLELADILYGAGLPQAAEMYVDCLAIISVVFIVWVISGRDLSLNICLIRIQSAD